MFSKSKNWRENYKQINKIATSNHNNVYLVEKNGENFILKESKNTRCSSQKMFNKTLKEIHVLQKLKHPAIPQFIDSNILNQGKNDKLYIIMEYFLGHTLKDHIRDKGVFSLKEAILFILGLLEILEHCIEQGIVHRDIKSQNIIVIKSSEGLYKPVLIDFGIAANIKEDISKTNINEEFGNREMRLPELSVGSENKIDVRTDIASCVNIFLILLTNETSNILLDAYGKAPHQRETIRKELNNNIKDPRILEDLLNIFDKGFDQNIDNRFQNSAELVQALQRINLEPKSIQVLSLEEQRKDLQNVNTNSYKKKTLHDDYTVLQKVMEFAMSTASETAVDLNKSKVIYVDTQADYICNHEVACTKIGLHRQSDPRVNFMFKVSAKIQNNETIISLESNENKAVYRYDKSKLPEKKIKENLQSYLINGLWESENRTV